MSTLTPSPSAGLILFGKTRRAVLALLYGRPEEDFYLREIVRAAGTGVGAVQRELRLLAGAGIVRRRVRGNQVYFQANPESPIFRELRGLVLKTAGLADVLRAALAPLAERTRAAFIYGSIAHGEERPGSDVDLLIVGDLTFAEAVSILGPAQETLGREVNPAVYPPGEFRKKLKAGHHFLKNVQNEPKIFVAGDERELKRLAH